MRTSNPNELKFYITHRNGCDIKGCSGGQDECIDDYNYLENNNLNYSVTKRQRIVTCSRETIGHIITTNDSHGKPKQRQEEGEEEEEEVSASIDSYDLPNVQISYLTYTYHVCRGRNRSNLSPNDISSENQESLNHFEHPSIKIRRIFLPPELVLLIFEYLDAYSLITCSSVNKTLRSLACEQALWKVQYLSKWLKGSGNWIFVRQYYPEKCDWKHLFKTRASVERRFLGIPHFTANRKLFHNSKPKFEGHRYFARSNALLDRTINGSQYIKDSTIDKDNSDDEIVTGSSSDCSSDVSDSNENHQPSNFRNYGISILSALESSSESSGDLINGNDSNNHNHHINNINSNLHDSYDPRDHGDDGDTLEEELEARTVTTKGTKCRKCVGDTRRDTHMIFWRGNNHHMIANSSTETSSGLSNSPNVNNGDEPVPLHWKSYAQRGQRLSKIISDDIEEFMILATVRSEEYASAVFFSISISNEINDSSFGLSFPHKQTNNSSSISGNELADLFYYWGHALKDMSIGLNTPQERITLLKRSEEKFKLAHDIDPTDRYVLCSWGNNLLNQMENSECVADIRLKFKESSRLQREAMKLGSSPACGFWGLAYLRLWMAKYYFLAGDIIQSEKYLERAEAKLQKLEQLCQALETRLIVLFSVSFNYACVYALKMKIALAFDREHEAKIYRKASKKRLKECLRKNFAQFLTYDLLDLWYLSEFRQKRWYRKVYKKAHKKRLIPEQA